MTKDYEEPRQSSCRKRQADGWDGQPTSLLSVVFPVGVLEGESRIVFLCLLVIWCNEVRHNQIEVEFPLRDHEALPPTQLQIVKSISIDESK